MQLDSDIMDLVIQKCIELFEREQKAEFPKGDIDYGKPPKILLIAYGMGKMGKAGCQITDIQKKWIYEDGHLKETDTQRVINKEQKNGMYYSEAAFEFSVDTDNYQVYLNLCFGPRYARGIRFELGQKGNTVCLCNADILWVS